MLGHHWGVGGFGARLAGEVLLAPGGQRPGALLLRPCRARRGLSPQLSGPSCAPATWGFQAGAGGCFASGKQWGEATFSTPSTPSFRGAGARGSEPLTDGVQGEQPVQGPDGGAAAGAVDAHRERAAPLAVDGSRGKPARDVPPRRVLPVFSAFFGLGAVPKSERS